jgi:hypothetical protein
MKKLIFALAAVLIMSFSAMAQSNTVTINSEGVTALETYGRALLTQNANDPTIFETTPGWPCEEQMTAQLAARMQQLANDCCCPVYICVQSSDCAWVLYLFRPNNGCDIVISEGDYAAY